MSTFLFNFKARFVPMVRHGQKRQTVRANRKDNRRPVPGDTVKLYSGLRTSSCHLLLEARCSECLGIRMSLDDGFGEGAGGELFINGEPQGPTERAEFARADGFSSWAEMADWFRQNHGPEFEGFCVKWEV